MHVGNIHQHLTHFEGKCGKLLPAWIVLRLAPPFFPGILLSRKPPETQRKRLVLEKNDG